MRSTIPTCLSVAGPQVLPSQQRLLWLSQSVTAAPVSEFIPHFALTQCNATRNNSGFHSHVSMRTVVLPRQLFQSLEGRSLVDIPWCQGQWQTHSISCINTFYVVTIFSLKVISIARFSYLKNSHFYFYQVFFMKFPHSQKTSGKKVIYAKCSLIKQLVFFPLLITKCLNRLHLRSYLSQPNGRWGGWAEFQEFICKPVVGKKENTFQVTDIMPQVWGGGGGVVRLPAACNWWTQGGWEEGTRPQGGWHDAQHQGSGKGRRNNCRRPPHPFL